MFIICVYNILHTWNASGNDVVKKIHNIQQIHSFLLEFETIHIISCYNTLHYKVGVDKYLFLLFIISVVCFIKRPSTDGSI